GGGTRPRESVSKKTPAGEAGRPPPPTPPPLLFHPAASELDMERDVRPFFESYRATLPPDREALFDRFRVVDVAYKVVGVGSVGTRCFIALFCGVPDHHLFLPLQQAPPPA